MNKYLVSSVLFPLIDLFYLKLISNHFSKLVKKITKEEMVFNMTKGIIAYIILAFGINYHIISDMNNNNINKKLLDSFILGLVIYGTFDFTNGAIFKDYDYTTMVIDTFWGAILHLLVTYLTYKITQ